MKAFLKNILSSLNSPEEAPLSEVESLLAEIEETRVKMQCAWNRLDYAAPDYVEIAVLELLLVETQYGILNKRYRLMLGINDNDFPALIEYRLTSEASRSNGTAIAPQSSSGTLSRSIPQ